MASGSRPELSANCSRIGCSPRSSAGQEKATIRGTWKAWWAMRGAPLTHHTQRRAQSPGHRLIVHSLGTGQHDPGPSRQKRLCTRPDASAIRSGRALPRSVSMVVWVARYASKISLYLNRLFRQYTCVIPRALKAGQTLLATVPPEVSNISSMNPGLPRRSWTASRTYSSSTSS